MKRLFYIKKAILFFLIVLVSVSAFAQSGPGGVSIDSPAYPSTPTSSTVKVWLDAGTITASDKALIDQWTDITVAGNDNTPTQSDDQYKPTFRNDAGVGINGQPILRFDGFKVLLFQSKDDINTDGPYSERTTFVVVRTASDVITRQVIYEQGGSARGLNIYIYNGLLHLAAWNEPNDGAHSPWNFVYTTIAVQPHTTYVITHVFDQPNDELKGYLNGTQFGPVNNIGLLYSHGNPPGLGACNEQTYFETGSHDDDNISCPFLGDIAEFIAYNSVLNDAERVIVENYLSAKYSANSSASTDKYAYQGSHGTEVIGIGQATGSSHRHSYSQGRNCFAIEGSTANFDDDEYLLVGHDNASISSWTSSNAPQDNTVRVEREWRFNHTGGDLGDITFRLNSNDLPVAPASEYTKYVLIIDKSGGLVSDFTSEQAEVIELIDIGSGYYEATSSIPDGAFMTFGMVEPMVNFTNTVGFAFETEVDETKTAELELNYMPATDVDVNISASDNTAVASSDFSLTSLSPVTIPAGSVTTTVNFDIVGDVVGEDTEDFLINLAATAGLTIGNDNSHTFTIYDNDNPPKVGFQNLTSTHAEDEATATRTVTVVRTGNTGGTSSVKYRLNTSGSTPTEGTATLSTDYTFAEGTVNFADGEDTKTFEFTLIDEGINETDETIKFELYDVSSGTDMEAGQNVHTATITNDDDVPTARFVDSDSENLETTSSPVIQVEISAVSAKDITINYNLTANTTAEVGKDFSLTAPGTVDILAGDLTANIPLIITQDEEDNEVEEIIEIELTGTNGNALLHAADIVHEYTITDYVSFEYEGVAGVGDAADNVFWYIADSLPGDDNDPVSELTDQSPNGFDLTQSNSNRPRIQTDLGDMINGHKVLRFDGDNDYFNIPDNVEINDNTEFRGKDMFLVLRTGSDVNSHQVIYEEGGGTNGMNIYIENNQLYYFIYCASYDWGSNLSGKNDSHVSVPIAANATYCISANYYYDSPANTYIRLYINGDLEAEVDQDDNALGILYSHSDDGCIGSINGSSRFHDNSTGAGEFEGDIAELIYYNEAPMNEARRQIVESYLMTKYDIDYDTPANKIYAYETAYGHELKGIGHVGTQHKDAQGSGRVRIYNASDLNMGEFLMLAHDNTNLQLNADDAPEGFSRFNRTWRVGHAGGDGVGTITFEIDLNGIPFNEAATLELLIDDDGNFATGATRHITGRSYEGGTKTLSFTDVSLSDGQYITIAIADIVWTGSSSSDWNDDSNWTVGEPTAYDVATIPASPVGGQFPEVNTSAEVWHLTIENGAELAVLPDYSLTTILDFDLNGKFTLQTPENSGAPGSFIDQGTISYGASADVHVERFLSRTEWHYLTPPVKSPDDDPASNATSALFTRAIHSFNSNLYTYDEGAAWPDGWVYAHNGQAGVDVNLQSGVGYAAYNNVYYTVDFTGELNTGEQVLPLTYTEGVNIEAQTGWNLVGNPFPSAVDWDADVTDPTYLQKNNVDNTIYFWDDDPAVKNYKYYNGASGGAGSYHGASLNGGTRYIPAMQAFFVRCNNNSGGSLALSNDARVHDTQKFYKTQSKDDLRPQSILLSVTNGQFDDEMLVRFISDASSEYDGRYDAFKLFTGEWNTQVPQIYSIGDQGKSMLAINSLAYAQELVVPVGFKVVEDGSYTIAVKDLYINGQVYLEDRYTGKRIDLKAQSAYQFDFSGGQENGRFLLHFVGLEDLGNDHGDTDDKVEEALIYAQKNIIHVDCSQLDASNERLLQVYDLNGMLVEQQPVREAYSSVRVSFAGTYIVKLISPDSTQIQKLSIVF